MSKDNNVLSMFFSDEEISNGEVKEPITTADEVQEESTTNLEHELSTEESIDSFTSESNEESVEESEETSKPEVEDSIVNDIPIVEKTKTEAELVVQDDGQFSLFGDDAILSEPKKEDEPTKDEDSSKKSSTSAKKSSSTGKPTASNKAKPQDIEVTNEWTIHYATNTFRVTDFINPMPASGKVKLEELRQEMEKEYFEMTQTRTKWDYDLTNKRLFPDVIGTSKGFL